MIIPDEDLQFLLNDMERLEMEFKKGRRRIEGYILKAM